ncbi:MAG: ribonuclease HII [Deltaproteobacteria bacterium]|nr:ribonuclease HII [Deltaproteobacteria bacterium]
MFLFKYEREYWNQYHLIAGLDEAGRGAWAGPVCAAAVIFEKNVVIEGVNDSKKLSPHKRETLFDQIKARCVSYGIGMIEPAVIDAINILEATKKAMIMALTQLKPQPDFLFIDGNIRLDYPLPQKPIIDGDALSHSIAAASILAKVSRDRLMIKMADQYPEYGFESHKGYGTKLHREILKKNGCLSIHRKSYAPISAILMEASR